MPPYALVWNNEAAVAFAALTKSAQRRLLGLLDEIKNHPFKSGDFQELDATGRANEVLLLDDWLATYWSDHALREVRLIRLEAVES